MTTTEHSSATIETTCARCGAVFRCGMLAGDTQCWCASLPPVPIHTQWTSCLCRSCLDDQLKTANHVPSPADPAH